MNKHRIIMGIFAFAISGAAGSGLALAQAPKKISVGDVAPIAADWPHFVAQDKGFYRAEGLEPQVTYVGNVANTVQQMVGGSFDVAVSTFDTAIRAIANGADAVLIGGVVVKYPYAIMAAPDVSKVQDLKGKQIILPFQKDLLTIVWNRWVREQGVQPSEIDQVYDGATPNRFAALTTKRVQAALLGQPFDFRASDEGFKTLLDIGGYAKDYGFLTLMARPKWLAENPDTARAYLRALAAAVDWIYDSANRDEAIAILAKGTKLDPAYATRTYDYFVKVLQPLSRGLVIPPAIVDSTTKTLVELGDIKQAALEGKKLVDQSYLPK